MRPAGIGGGRRALGIKVCMDLPPEPESAKKARDSLGRFAASIPSHKLDGARLAVSEIVTNSLRHAKLSTKDDKISLHIEAADGILGGEVCDTGNGFEPPPEASPGDFLEGGWGLYLVDTVCERWGVKKGEMFCVWFEIKL